MAATKLNLTAPVNSLGYGQVGKNLLAALEAAGAECAWWPIGPVEAEPQYHEVLRTSQSRQASYDPSAPSLRVFHQFDLAQHVGHSLRCAMPIFELDRFRPAELHHLRCQDLIFATSHWAKHVLLANGLRDEAVSVAPLGVDPLAFPPAPANGPGPTVFLNVGKWELRKGHDVLIEAFCKAFTPADDVRLLMHCHNPCFADAERGSAYNREWERLYQTSALSHRVKLTHGRFACQKDVYSLMASADCGVFPARAEGFNLEAAEMLAMGRHVILTGCSAHTEFADESCAMTVVPGPPEDAHDGVWFRADAADWGGRPGRWASLGECAIEQMVEHMRCVHKKKQEGSLGANRAGVERMQSFTWGHTARAILDVLS